MSTLKYFQVLTLRVEENTSELGGVPDVILTESNIPTTSMFGRKFV